MADTALRLARYFGTSVEFWTGIQSHYDTDRARMELGNRLEREVKVMTRVAKTVIAGISPTIVSMCKICNNLTPLNHYFF
jgi:hypothetical protein